MSSALPLPDALAVRWSPIYTPVWDKTPHAYVDAGLVGIGRSRRLARVEDSSQAFKAYLGVQHWDPSRWGLLGEARAVFFLSLFHHNRTLTLRTFPRLPDAIAALTDVWNALA